MGVAVDNGRLSDEAPETIAAIALGWVTSLAHPLDGTTILGTGLIK